jgi:hypothetical protein
VAYVLNNMELVEFDEARGKVILKEGQCLLERQGGGF